MKPENPDWPADVEHRLRRIERTIPYLFRLNIVCLPGVPDCGGGDLRSPCWANLKAALAPYFAGYNFCRFHRSIRMTPAMEAGITNHVWELREIITE